MFVLMPLTVTANDGFDLREAYDRILDGELGDLVVLDTLKAQEKQGSVFGAGGGRIPKITVQLKSPVTDQEKAELLAKLAEMFGTNAHIHMDA